MVLLAVCNYRYEFTLVDVGAYGGESDGGIFGKSSIIIGIETKTLDIPAEQPNLPDTNLRTPLFFVSDAFGLTKYMMKPYPGRGLNEGERIFNYRLSRTRRCIENAFGILVARWRVFLKPIGFHPEDVKYIINACLCLHNF